MKTAARPQKRTYYKPDRDRLDEAIIAAVALEHPTTVRSVFYRVVSAGACPKTESAYEKISDRLVELRRSGRVSYEDVSDGTRPIFETPAFDSIGEAVDDMIYFYKRRLWTDSEFSLILFSEKDAMTAVVRPTTYRLHVPLGVMRGFSSETFAWKVAQRMDAEKVNVIAQLGDHDPSGVHAWDDFVAKIRAFAPGVVIEAERLAVLPWQIDAWDLPTRPPKEKTKKAADFGECVEVDAIPPGRVRELVAEWIGRYLDPELHAAVLDEEQRDRQRLAGFVASLGTDGAL